MDLNLKNPLIFFDLESTGLDIVHDQILELSYIKVYPGGREEEKTYRFRPTQWMLGKEVTMHIPEASSAVHHIFDEDVKDAPTFGEKADEIARVFLGCDLCGYNSSKFDLPMLGESFCRAKNRGQLTVDIDLATVKMIDVQTIYYKMYPRTLAAAYRDYYGKDFDGAHSANADTRATYDVLKAQLDRHAQLQNDVDSLVKFSNFNRNADLYGRLIYNDNHEVVVNFGKHKGVLLRDVFRIDKGYYDWIMKSDFPETTKQVFTREYLRGKQ